MLPMLRRAVSLAAASRASMQVSDMAQAYLAVSLTGRLKDVMKTVKK